MHEFHTCNICHEQREFQDSSGKNLFIVVPEEVSHDVTVSLEDIWNSNILSEQVPDHKCVGCGWSGQEHVQNIGKIDSFLAIAFKRAAMVDNEDRVYHKTRVILPIDLWLQATYFQPMSTQFNAVTRQYD
jgi:hypothetical protein